MFLKFLIKRVIIIYNMENNFLYEYKFKIIFVLFILVYLSII